MLGALVTSPTLDLGHSKPKSRSATERPFSDAHISPVTRTAISLEYASLRHKGHCPLGIYALPTENLMLWDAVFFIHQGYYADSILKFQITFPHKYPEGPPVVTFSPDVFHPLISQQTGIFSLVPRFRPWRPKEHSVFEILHWIKAAFKKHALDEMKESDCLNKEAFRLYHETTASFAALATQSSMLSQSPSALFDKDPRSIRTRQDGMLFKELKPEQSESMRSKLGLLPWDDEDS